MTTTTTSSAPRRTPTLDRPTAMRLAAGEYERFTAMLRSLAPEDWRRPTDCPGWDVRAMAGHTLGMAEMAASILESRRQMKAAKDRGGGIDALTAVQVDKHRDRTPAEIVARMELAGPKAARSRRRTPGFIRRRSMPERQIVDGVEEEWTFGFLIDVILTRDPWMHRVDISRAVGHDDMQLSADHDGVLVADVVAEWASRHGQPYTLRLTGPASGRWSDGSGGPELELDAVEFCRLVSGRGRGDGLLGVQVPF